jgi:hypothetical protein
MTTNEVIRLAREAGIEFNEHRGLTGRLNTLTHGSQTLKAISKLIELAKAEALAEQWEDINSAPKDGTKFDAWDGDVRWTDVFWGIPTYANLSDRAWVIAEEMAYGIEFVQLFGLTHWRPLPPPPSMKEAT